MQLLTDDDMPNGRNGSYTELHAISVPGHPEVISYNAQRNPPTLVGKPVNSRGPVYPAVNLYQKGRTGGELKQDGVGDVPG